MKTIEIPEVFKNRTSMAGSVVAETALKLLRGATPRSGGEFLELEERAAAAGRQVTDKILATHVLLAHRDEVFVEACVRAARASTETRLRRSGTREVEIRLSSGVNSTGGRRRGLTT